jgi:chromosome segregation protein
MQLTKLEIKGFKSFGDRVVINFDKGVTGIVGPNGCGKSNVVDAIRWVLGEQKTRMLRSDKMENVIFNGTKNRKPTQMAEVSLSFNNTKNLLPTEYATITITRKYYRTGESEYLLNGVPCRLKDITNLFLDTGITSNSYAIIELKMVDDLLNDKDNSRRELFEEAAGISKFKKRKKETLRRLEDTDADLNRVEDLLFEIEKNMRSLERQAKQTEKYFQYKDEYKQLSIQLAVKQSAGLVRARMELDKTIRDEEDRRVKLIADNAKIESELESDRNTIISSEKLLSSRQKTLNEHVGRIRQVESERKIKDERQKFLSEKSRDLADKISSDKESLERVTFSLKSLREESNSLEKIYAESEARVALLKSTAEEQKRKAASLQEQLTAANQAIKILRDKVYQEGKSLEIKEIQRNSLKLELEKSASGTKEQADKLGEFDDKLEELGLKLESLKDRLEELQYSETNMNTQRSALEKSLEDNKDELITLKRQLDAKDNEFKLSKSLVDNLEGFPEATKYLKKNARWAKDSPLLSDIITCEDQYRVPIENYLDAYMNYFVVEHESQAVEAVSLLAESNRGKANFFILSQLSRIDHPEFKAPVGSIRVMDIIEFDATYGVLLHNLLGNVYILNDSRLQKPEEGLVYLSADGQMSRRKAVISGGSVGLFEGKKIGRARNLEVLGKTIKSLEKKIASLEDEGLKLQSQLSLVKSQSRLSEMEELKRQINLLEQEFSALNSRKDQIGQFIRSEETKREDILNAIARLESEIESARPMVLQLTEQLHHKEEHQAELAEEAAIQSELATQRGSEFNEENIRFFQQKNKWESLHREIEYKEQNLEATLNRIAENQDELNRVDGEIKKLLSVSSDSEDELLGLYEEKERIELGVNEAEKDYYQLRGTINEKEKQSREIQRTKELVDNLLFDLKSRLSELTLQLQSLTDRLSVEFSFDLSEGIQEVEPTDQSEAELKEAVQKVKEKMERLGPINPMAMEAYHEVKERHEFITTQRDDLLNAKQDLLNTIAEIDGVAKENFLDAFHKIKANFIHVFRSLFTEEDDCDLILTEPDNPLESSIDITAKPKGKRPLSINQLSGGEKTLTATSLLFAIYLLKPAPFCIFDEVDAPLDDANIDKFNNIIRTFSKDSQFIIVTHNKRTMASTDIIYGITMIEQGVSRVVPVDLREAV